MTLHIYLDGALTQPVSEGDGSRPDADSYNGTDGESRDRQLFVANEQSVLAAPLDTVQTQLELTAPRFQDGEIVIIGNEQLRIIAGGGASSLIVDRGASGTTSANHAAGAIVYSAYDYSGLTVQPIDVTGADESGWYRLALTQAGLAGAAPGAPLNLGDKPHTLAVSFWRRCTVPPATAVQNKLDLKLRLTGVESPIQ